MWVQLYEVNLSTNEKVITEKQNFNTKLLKNNVEYQGHLKVNVMVLHVCLSNIVCEYEVNPLTNDKVITEIQMIKLLKNKVKRQGHLKVKVIMLHVCEKVLTLCNNVYEVNQLINEKVIRQKRNFNANC